MGIAWSLEKRAELENLFDLDECTLSLSFTFSSEMNACFPRKFKDSFVADFAIYSLPHGSFQSEEISMVFESINYQWFAGGQSKKVQI